MSQSGEQPEKRRRRYAFNLTLAAVAGQVGCLTLLVIFFALFGGLWLDNRFQTRPVFTIILMIGSVPITLLGMFWVVRQTTAWIKPSSAAPDELRNKEPDRGRNP